MRGYEELYYRRRTPYLGEEDNENMNEWRGEVSSPADSYIEWRFEYKCRQLSGGFDIITEWRTHKQEYIGKSSTTIFDFQHYSRHDVTHSISILESIELLLGRKRIDLLSAGDLWLLLEVAYGHDLGMATRYDELSDLWAKDPEFQRFIRECLEDDLGESSEAALFYKQADNLLRSGDKMADLEDKEEIDYPGDWPVLMQKYIMLLATEYIRKRHADRVRDVFAQAQKSEGEIPPRLYLVAGIGAQMHGRNFGDIFEELEYRVKGFGVGKIHPQFAAAMLRIGDLLDMDNNRFNPYAVAHFGRLPMSSMLHLKKHKCITHIDISEFEIAAKGHTDEYEVAVLTNDWFQSIAREVDLLICHWNEIVPEALLGCTLKPSNCKVFLRNNKNGAYQQFDNQLEKTFTVNKKKLINLLIGTSIYDSEKDFLREYLQNALDASKVQLWLDLKSGRYEHQKNPKVTEWKELTPFDLEQTVYDNYKIDIAVEWNKSKDKIRLKIQDRGIGIESNYLKFLTNVGTGWKSRDEYTEELKEMVRWLYPTGGFGIGIQSAFMVTDTVEIFTKSEKDSCAHRIILQNPGKGGNISSEKIFNYHVRGTTVTIELEAEKFQKWMKSIDKKVITDRKYSAYACDFDPEKWDEFEPEANLLYICDFLHQYIEAVLPTTIFPIEISNGIKKGKIFRSIYWPDNKYWENSSNSLFGHVIQNGKRYLCIYVPKNRKNVTDGFVIIWDMKDQVLLIIHPEISLGNTAKAYFKNVAVEHVENISFGIFKNYELHIDFMGLFAEKCLKVHRNAFSEDFNLEEYCYAGTRAYMEFVKTAYKKCEVPKAADKASNAKAYLDRVWTSFELQVLRLLCFDDVGEYAEISGGKFIKVTKGEVVSTSENEIIPIAHEGFVSEQEVMMFLKSFYDALYGKGAAGNKHGGILLELKEKDLDRIKKDRMYKGENEIHPNAIKRWNENNMQEGDRKDGKILDLFVKGIGVIKDPFVVQMLIDDIRLEKQMVHVFSGMDYLFVTVPEKKTIVGKESIFEKFWSSLARGNSNRRYIKADGITDYSELWVKDLPFTKENTRKGEGYLIAPVSVSAYSRVKKYIDQGRYMDYSIFRELVWGIKGHETQEYHMLIEWVVRHQCMPFRYKKREIIEKYEDLLQDIYNAKVEDR